MTTIKTAEKETINLPLRSGFISLQVNSNRLVCRTYLLVRRAERKALRYEGGSERIEKKNICVRVFPLLSSNAIINNGKRREGLPVLLLFQLQRVKLKSYCLRHNSRYSCKKC